MTNHDYFEKFRIFLFSTCIASLTLISSCALTRAIWAFTWSISSSLLPDIVVFLTFRPETTKTPINAFYTQKNPRTHNLLCKSKSLANTRALIYLKCSLNVKLTSPDRRRLETYSWIGS
jgi:hypothetical protein